MISPYASDDNLAPAAAIVDLRNAPETRLYEVTDLLDGCPSPQQRLTELAELVAACVWQKRGQEISIEPALSSGSLKVRHTDAGHDDVERILQQLRQATRSESLIVELVTLDGDDLAELRIAPNKSHAVVPSAQWQRLAGDVATRQLTGAATDDEGAESSLGAARQAVEQRTPGRQLHEIRESRWRLPNGGEVLVEARPLSDGLLRVEARHEADQVVHNECCRELRRGTCLLFNVADTSSAASSDDLTTIVTWVQSALRRSVSPNAPRQFVLIRLQDNDGAAPNEAAGIAP